MSFRRAPGPMACLLLLASACGDDAGTTSGGGGGSDSITTGVGGAGPNGNGGDASTSSQSAAGGNGPTSSSQQTSTTQAGGGGDGGGSTGSDAVGSGGGGGAPLGPPIQNVFIITMENHSWDEIEGSASAPYINGTLAPMAARAGNYMTPPGLHPSEPNYIWLEAGSNLGIDNDDPPADNIQSTTDHLVTQLEAAGVSWKTYAQGIDGTVCPLEDDGLYAPKHVPQLFFSDVTDGNSPDAARCIEHVRPYDELSADLTSGDVPRYTFITPDLCNDMHGESFGFECNTFFDDLIARGDAYLSEVIPMIMASAAYQEGGLIIVWWDEGTESFSGASDGPLPFFVISANARPGYVGNEPYTHSTTLRSLQEIFGVSPFLGGAATSNDLSDLFTSFP